MTSVTVTSASPAVVTWTTHGLYNGMDVRFAGTAVPTGMAIYTDYYVRWVSTNTFQISSINLSKVTTITIGNPTTTFNCVGHGLIAGDKFYLTTNGTLPSGLTVTTGSVAPTYYTVATAVADSFTVTVTTTTAGSGTHIFTKHTAVNTSSTGTAVTAEAYDPSFQMTASNMVFGGGAVNISNVTIPVPVTLTGLVSGSTVRVSQTNDNTELSLGVVADGTYSFLTKYQGAVTVRVRKTTGYLPFEASAVINNNGLSLLVTQIVDTYA